MTDAIDARIRAILNATTPLAVLGLQRTASSADIRKRYLDYSRIIHPDRCAHKDAQAACQRVNASYQALSDAPRPAPSAAWEPSAATAAPRWNAEPAAATAAAHKAWDAPQRPTASAAWDPPRQPSVARREVL